MDLDTPLGRWLPVKRHTWFTLYRSAQHVYWRTDAGLLRLKPSTTRGFYIEDCLVDSLPLETHLSYTSKWNGPYGYTGSTGCRRR